MAAWGYEFCLLVLNVSFTRSLRSLVRYFQHSKIKFVSPRSHVISSIYGQYRYSKMYNLSIRVQC